MILEHVACAQGRRHPQGLLVEAAGEKDDRDRAEARVVHELLADAQPVPCRHVDVQDEQVRRCGERLDDDVQPVRDGAHLEAELAALQRKGVQELPVVIGQQHAFARTRLDHLLHHGQKR